MILARGRLPACLAPAALLLAAVAAWPQTPASPVTWSAALEASSGSLPAGASFVIAVTARIEEGWHVYGLKATPNGPRPLRISLGPGQPFTAGRLRAPEPTSAPDGAFGRITALYDETTVFRLPATVSVQATPGPHLVTLEVSFQACDGRVCLPGRRLELTVPVTVAGAARP